MSSSGPETHSIFDGIKPAKCWGYYDAKFTECRVKCKISQYCQPATARKNAGKKPNTVVPPQPEKVEAIPEPVPSEYFIEQFKGKWNVTEAKATEHVAMFDVRSDEGALVVRVGMRLDGSGGVQAQHKKGKHQGIVNSLDSAKDFFEEIIAKLTS